MKVRTILEAVGGTPHVKINRLFGEEHDVWMKLERSNPGGSIKDRIALAMVDDAERRGKLGPDSVIVEPTSGNTGIGLAMVAAVKRYRLILVMPESMSVERRKLMAAYGAEFELMIIPQTLAETVFGDYGPGTAVNLEVDVIARYLERLLQGDAAAQAGAGALTLQTLADNGYLGTKQ